MNDIDIIKLYEKENTRKEELKIILFNNRILKKLLSPVEVYKKDGVIKSLFVFNPFFVNVSSIYKTLNKKFISLERVEKFVIDSSSNVAYWEASEFQNIIQQEETREKVENALVEEFARNLDNHHLVKAICQKENYHLDSIKKFNELNKENPKEFFNSLLNHIDYFGSNAKDFLIIADRETFRFIKQNDPNNIFQNLVGDIISTNSLEKNTKLIIISQRGILMPFFFNRFNSSGYHYFEIYYEINLMDNNPIMFFKEETVSNDSVV